MSNASLPANSPVAKVNIAAIHNRLYGFFVRIDQKTDFKFLGITGLR